MNSLRKYDKYASFWEDPASTFDLFGTLDLVLETIKKSNSDRIKRKTIEHDLSTVGKNMDLILNHLRK
jgi:hypothetical protein